MISNISFFTEKLFNDSDKKKSIEKLERKINCSLSKKFNLFLETFDLGNEKMKTQYVLVPKKGFIHVLGYWVHNSLGIDDADVNIDGIFNIHELNNDWNEYSFDSMEFEENMLLRIGLTDTGGGIYIGIEGKKEGKIYNVIWDFEDELFLRGNNIFEFIRGLTFKVDNSNIEGVNYFQLYKNWGESFWRVVLDKTKPIENIEFIAHRGFDFVELRLLNENIDVKHLESKYQLIFPFKFRTFLEHFKFKGKTGLNLEKIYDEKTDKTIHFEKPVFAPIKIKGESIVLAKMWNEETFLDSLKNFRATKIWQNHQLLTIGQTEKGNYIGVGIEGENAEEVWLIEETDGTATKLADDIFKFIRGIEPIYQEEYLNKIYKNWGEDFWRIKKP